MSIPSTLTYHLIAAYEEGLPQTVNLFRIQWLSDLQLVKAISSPTIPGIMSLSFLNRLPCNGLVKLSALIIPVGQYSILISFCLIQSVIKKYLM